jgi:hypothetical protein
MSSALPRNVVGMAATGEPVRVEIAEKKRGLEEDEAGEPDRGRASEHGKKLFRGERLNQEEQKRRKEGRDSVENAA